MIPVVYRTPQTKTILPPGADGSCLNGEHQEPSSGEVRKAKMILFIEPALLSRKQAAQSLSVSLSTLDDLVAEGALSSVQLGGRRMFRPADLAGFADALPVAPPDRLKKKRENPDFDS